MAQLRSMPWLRHSFFINNYFIEDDAVTDLCMLNRQTAP